MEFGAPGPQIGPQIIIFENYITSSLTGTKNQFHILNGWDLSLCQVFMSENTLYISMLSSFRFLSGN